MACSIIICQAADHQLVPSDNSPNSIHRVQLAAARLQLATYARQEDRWHRFEADWMAGRVAAELNQTTPADVVLVADHDTIERFRGDARLVRAEYGGGESELPAIVGRALAEESAALEDLLAWFWANSLELPLSGLRSLSGLLGWRGGSMAARWNTVRSRREYHQAIDWLGLLDPGRVEDPDYRFAKSLVAGQGSVEVADQQRLQRWLESVDLTDAALFRGFRDRALTGTTP